MPVALLAIGAAVACATGGGHATANISNQTVTDISSGASSSNAEISCSHCSAVPMPSDVTQALEHRIADLESRGGDCSRYGKVLETSFRNGRITIRPYMWRVGKYLASGEAKPNGDMTLAREIDSLNVGVRTVDDVVWSIEHEAVHIAFDLPSGSESSEDKANQTVRACRPRLSALIEPTDSNWSGATWKRLKRCLSVAPAVRPGSAIFSPTALKSSPKNSVVKRRIG